MATGTSRTSTALVMSMGVRDRRNWVVFTGAGSSSSPPYSCRCYRACWTHRDTAAPVRIGGADRPDRPDVSKIGARMPGSLKRRRCRSGLGCSRLPSSACEEAPYDRFIPGPGSSPAESRPKPSPRPGPGHRSRGDGGRPLGRPRRQGGRRRRRRRRDAQADQLGADAGRRGDRRGREGQRADAVQRRGGRRRHRPAGGRRRRPDRRHHADEQGHAERDRGARGRRARRDVRSERRLLHGEAGRRPGLRRRDRHQRRRAGEPAPDRQGQEDLDLRRHGLHPGPPAARAS